MIDPLLQRPLEMRHTLRTTSKLHLLTKVIPPLPTNPTFSTRNPYFERYTIAELKARDRSPNGDDDTGGFMAER